MVEKPSDANFAKALGVTDSTVAAATKVGYSLPMQPNIGPAAPPKLVYVAGTGAVPYKAIPTVSLDPGGGSSVDGTCQQFDRAHIVSDGCAFTVSDVFLMVLKGRLAQFVYTLDRFRVVIDIAKITNVQITNNNAGTLPLIVYDHKPSGAKPEAPVLVDPNASKATAEFTDILAKVNEAGSLLGVFTKPAPVPAVFPTVKAANLVRIQKRKPGIVWLGNPTPLPLPGEPADDLGHSTRTPDAGTEGASHQGEP